MKTKELSLFSVYLVYHLIALILPLKLFGGIPQLVVLAMFYPLLGYRYQRLAVMLNLALMVRPVYMMYPAWVESVNLAYNINEDVSVLDLLIAEHKTMSYLCAIVSGMAVSVLGIKYKLRRIGYYKRLKTQQLHK